MASNFTVVYDACVLYPAPLRDLLMHLALTDMYRARWSNMIHDEWTRNVLKSRKDLKPEAIARTRQLMDAHVRQALVENFEHLIPAIQLPDPDDRHVVAAAMHAGAELIITFNRKDFPAAELEKYNVSAQHPDDFIFDLFDLNAAKVLQAAARHRKSMKNPPKSVEDYLDTLAAQGLTQTVNVLRPLAWAL
jgi:predicted nucleic acid-binding protein